MQGALTLVVAGVLIFAAPAAADIVFESESDGSAVNNTRAAAQPLGAGAFTLPVPGTVFDPPGFPTATIQGRSGAGDVDFYRFDALGGSVYLDMDNSLSFFDPVLALFDGSGTLLALGDDSFPEDEGSASGSDPFAGVFELPGPGRYFLGVSTFPNFPSAFSAAAGLVPLVRPDGEFGGFAVLDAPMGASSYDLDGWQEGTGYTLYVSVQNPVPEPSSIALFGTLLGIAAVGIRRRKNR